MQRTSQAREVRAVQPFAVDLTGRDHLHRDPRGAPEDGAEKLLPLLRATCFESFRNESGRTRWSRKRA